ncbi:hypothetical protein [Sphingomonas jeddahensis]|uniref:Uncharacterized protein n=1 Tax=Sphingomonas jeddahensis TaxID=1915074 RepID=A0A1V2EUT3_9SPHN|nr:hypothetical protein [Sphingomonas jeddahensis]ONF96436.1 hypothetical protein SPHI_12210 [Sphingomonas jeddahensis]
MVADVEVPAGFVPQYAIAFGAVDGPATAVHAGNPLPVRAARQPAAAPPLAGSLTASGMAGPFVPELDRPIWVTLSGDWSGTVELLRSTDGGATAVPLTAGGAPWARFTANANEAVADESEAGATYHLSATLLGGTLTYRVAQ